MSERTEAKVLTQEVIERQTAAIERLRKRLEGKNLLYSLTTMGCQMNAHDSEKLKGVLEAIGYKETDDETLADFVLYNTCAVRENAELKVYGKVGYLITLKRKNPNLLIVLCGCMMQQGTVIQKLKKSYRHVDIVFGTHNIYKLAELIETRLDTKTTVFDIWDEHQEIVEDLPSIRKNKHKASVNIMYGCNNFCSYCIVPYVRGRERSRYMEDIIDEIKELVADGVKEINLLGQNVNSYGLKLEEPTTFAELLEQASLVEGLERLRFMTPHPKDLSDEVIKVMAKSDRISPYLHLPIQSGSTKILKAMNRKYTKEDYLALVDRINKAMPGIALTTDIIVGFPGETEEDFLETLDIIERVRYDSAFTFIYSIRT
ncbi:MAG: tRNA (N6-isopentenyl adenosine(37)-C2)-methylthiotransferase MiaB, partial [Vallitaleaceae bacterium]|nr:tRNA (N6-isopentenyl adenosine(37)-C2)-methylthiotransferase MiaB [Vallitaleaceae bacterium]